MADWESHREVLKGLYLGDDKPLTEIKKHLAEYYSFNASKAQYEAQFKKWEWRKNLKKSDWRYVSRKIDERKRHGDGKGSAVFLNGSIVPFEKVKREISRHVHPNDQFYLQAIPQSPGDVIVCTPPAESMASTPCIIAGMTSAKRKHLDEQLPLELIITKRRQMMPVAREATSGIASTLDDLPPVNVISRVRSPTCGPIQESSITQTRKEITPAAINLDGLPFFQFQRMMRSRDVVHGLETILTVNDTLVEKLVANYWPQSSLPHHSDSYLHSLEPDPKVYNSDTDDGFESLSAYLPMQDSQLPLCKPLGIELLANGYSHKDSDIIEWPPDATMVVPALLANMPRIEGDDLQMSIDLLLGPPTVESVRLLVEVGVYLSSNNMENDNIITWMLRIVPWAVLRPILSARVSTIQAFAANVLRAATDIENVRVVSDLLEAPSLKRLVRTSGEWLVRAVETSNAALVRVFVHAGASVDVTERVPLVQAKTVGIARILVEAGADVNASGYSSDWLVQDAPALVVAVIRGDVKLARYLIRAGAGVNVSSAGSKCITALACAARGDQIELLQLLLKQGADVNHVCPQDRFCRHQHSDALQWAAESGNLDFVRLLVEAGADVNAPAYHPERKTALQAASFQGHLEMVTFLLNRGANVNAPGNSDDRFPKTVLTTAVERNHLELVELLLDAGADVNMPSFGYYGCTALEAAKSRPASFDIVNLLIAKGARDAALLLGSHRKIELCEAVRRGDFSRVQFLASLGVQIDMQFETGETILHWALTHWALTRHSSNVNVELFRFLVDHVEDVNAQNESSSLQPILHVAIEYQNMEVVEILIDAGADINVFWYEDGTPLMAAAYSGNCEMVHFLLSREADINAIVKGEYATTALQASLESGKLDVFYFLLANGAVINAPISERGSSELAYAARRGNIRLVRDLLDQGADVNSAPGYMGSTPLQGAAALDPPNIAMVQLLLERGADVNAPPADKCGSTALQAATARGQFQLALLLLEAGADVNAQNPWMYHTTLETAARFGRLDILYLLLKAGADTHLPIEERYVEAAFIARRHGHVAIAEILEGWDKTGGVQDDREERAQNFMDKEKVVELN